ncbi:molybdate transport system substrate-binding protein [Bryocella elongata]|uniref:Molybdate transport system substrate-binding protein n=1 Tax=Bryocella elongata TaxID=863522 RepID=A0A1H5ZP88_9BACT|nr:molybdate ABC transporter substrate-binding protein [Bryocella elongata]SEG38229.1 molybdate transport system substrate-binding protein [Bryocella elongata]
MLTAVLGAIFSDAPLTAQVAAPKGVLHVAAAADLQPVLPALAEEYERASGIKIVPSFGSSATLTQQLESGAPFDVFLSADRAHPEQLVAASLTTSPQPVPYAHGVLVLWARKDSPAQPLSLTSLTRDKVSRIAVANELHAPYGLAAMTELRALKLDDKLKPKLVVAENIAQTAEFAASGNAQAGLISLTIASSPKFRELGTFVPLPVLYAPLIQCAVVMRSAKDPDVAKAFVAWLTSPAIQHRLKDFGLEPAIP